MTDRAISPDKAISPLRRRMIEDMAIRKLARFHETDHIGGYSQSGQIRVSPVTSAALGFSRIGFELRKRWSK